VTVDSVTAPSMSPKIVASSALSRASPSAILPGNSDASHSLVYPPAVALTHNQFFTAQRAGAAGVESSGDDQSHSPHQSRQPHGGRAGNATAQSRNF